ncbi:hypothetical protein N9W79_02125 [bacterium]|nr:hypothetical protein [bacterium]
MAKSAKTKFELQCRILQNGRPVKNFVAPFGESHHLFATSNGDDPLGITHYPLSRPISVVEISKHGTFVEIDHPWEGFLLSEGEIIEINGYSDLGKSFKITPGDFASLAWHDIRILLKVAPKEKDEKQAGKLLKSNFRGPLLAKLSKSKAESTGLTMAIFATLILFGFMLTGLNNRTQIKPERFEALPLDYVAPFVSADHIRTSPEALQNFLDRKDYIGSIFRYYRSMSTILLGKTDEISRSIFGSLVDKVEDEQGVVKRKI